MSVEAFRAAMIARGMRPPPHIEPGKLHRCASSDKAGDTAGWCKLFDDQRGGVYGDWREGWQETWQAERERPMTAAKREAFSSLVREAAQQREADAHARQGEAAMRAAQLWQVAKVAPADHPYLIAKGIKAHGLRIHDGALVVPVRNGAELQSLQFIDADGGKRFMPGGRVAGGYFAIGKPELVLCIAEGYATGATIHEATGHPVAVAFNAGNMLSVAQAMRVKFPELRLILCADDDAQTEGNPGLVKARAAASAIGGYLAAPDFGANRPERVTDFNDLARHADADAVRACIARAEGMPRSVGAANGGTEARAILTRGDTIKPVPTNWLWPGWLAAGKFHLIAGAPGTGKTTLAIGLAAPVTCGGRWPDGTAAELGSVVMWSGEDDPADVLIPRVIASGGDRRRLHVVSGIIADGGRRPFDPSHDVDLLAAALREITDVRLLIVDPIVVAVAGDSHKNAEVRRGLQPLVDLAQTHQFALLGITHLSKGTAGRDPVERVTGSLAFGALARVVLMAAKQEAEGDRPARRVLMRAKSNIGLDEGGYAYELRQSELEDHPGVFASAAHWAGAVEGTARELMAEADQQSDEPGGDDAADFLRNLLEAGARPAKEIYAEAEGAGYSRDAMKRAKNRIRASVHKLGMTGGWLWQLPEERTGESEGSTLPRLRSSHSSALPSGNGVDL